MNIETTIQTNELNDVIHTEPKRGRGRPKIYRNEQERIAHYKLVAEAKKQANRAEREAIKAATIEREKTRATVGPDPLLLSVGQAAQALQVSKETVRSLIRAQHLPATKIFGILRIQRDAVTTLATIGTDVYCG